MMIGKKNYGWFIVLGLSFLPVLLWLNAESFIPRFSDFTTGMANIGQILGLVGMAMFAISLILSARFRFWEKYFNGLNVIYSGHNRLGQTAFVLLLFHPLFLLPKYAGNSFYAAYVFLAPTGNWAKNWGWLSLGALIVLVVLTLYLRPRYDIWKWMHKFMGLVFLMAVLHLWLTPSDTSRDGLLRTYMLGISFAGLAVFAYRTLLGNFFIKRIKYIVIGVRRLNQSLVEITMDPQGERMRFTPGQFIFVSFLDKNIGSESHPFSIVSGLNEASLTIVVKDLGDFTGKLAGLAIGSEALIEGPFGLFSYKNSEFKNQIWIAGGIGITPFLSMAKSLMLGEGYHVDLYYCTRNKAEAIYPDVLQKISARMDNSFRFFNFCSEEFGYHINAEVVRDNYGSLENKDIFICAPPGMIQMFKEQFAEKGVDKKLIHSEEFNF